MDKDIQLYIGYINNEQKDKFNLKDNQNVHLINLSNHIEGEDINHINCHYSELCVAYYVWKHQLKADYISIGQHRRYINPINFERLDNDEIQVFPILAHTDNLPPYKYLFKDGFNSYIILTFIKYLLKNKIATKDKIYNVIYKQNFDISYFNVFACNWKVFNEICNFIFNFTQELLFNGNFDSLEDINQWNDDIRLSYQESEFIINKSDLLGNFNDGRVVTYDRNIAAIFELLIPLFGKIYSNTFFEINNKKLGVEINDFDINTIYDKVLKWTSKNTFTGTLEYYIKTKKENIEILKNILDPHWYGLSSGYVNIVMDFPENTIQLKLNEYIDCNNPLEELNIDNIKQYE